MLTLVTLVRGTNVSILPVPELQHDRWTLRDEAGAAENGGVRERLVKNVDLINVLERHSIG
jgi:hypothetical protein